MTELPIPHCPKCHGDRWACQAKLEAENNRIITVLVCDNCEEAVEMKDNEDDRAR